MKTYYASELLTLVIIFLMQALVMFILPENHPLPIQNWSVHSEIVSKAMSWYNSADTPRGLVNLSVPICIFWMKETPIYTIKRLIVWLKCQQHAQKSYSRCKSLNCFFCVGNRLINVTYKKQTNCHARIFLVISVFYRESYGTPSKLLPYQNI